LTSEKPKTKSTDFGSPGLQKTDSNYTKLSKTESIYTNQPIIEEDWMRCRKDLWEAMECDELCEHYPRERVCALADLVVEMLCSTEPMVRVGKNTFPIRAVKHRLLLLNRHHIAYVLDELNRTTAEIHNVKGYVLAMLFNAPTTMDIHYQMKLQRDFAAE